MSDQQVRDAAETQLGQSFALSAGAGTGKTTVLVRRLTALLKSGVDPARIAAVTFTEAAAAEIAIRVRDAVEAGRPHPHLDAAAARLGELRISTLHAFCQRLLEVEALAAEWAPNTGVVTDTPATRLCFRAWRTEFAHRHPEASASLWVRCAPRQVENLATSLLHHRKLEPVVSDVVFDTASVCADLEAVADDIEAAAALCKDPDDKLFAAGVAFRLRLSRLRKEPNATRLVSALRLSRAFVVGGKAKAWPDDAKETYVAAVRAFESWQQGVGTKLHATLVSDLVTHFLPAALAARADVGEHQFDDLLILAADLLRNDVPARTRSRARYDALLIDEVQDTDPVQAEVALLLSRDPALSGSWDSYPPQPGRLFAVGDPKQSIYRFRGADVGAWRRLSTAVGQAGDEGALVRCFRSVPGIVDFVNHCFAQLPEYEPLVAQRGPVSDLDPVVALRVGDDNAHDALAAYLVDLKATTDLRWSEVLVQIPAWTQAEAIRFAFAKVGIPTVVEGARAFYSRDEIRVALSAMAAVDEPADGEATVFTLRALFGIDATTLAQHRAAGGSWRCTAPDQPKGPVADALSVLSELHRRRYRGSWVGVLDELLHVSRAAAVWALRPDGALRLGNLDKLRDLIRMAEADVRTPGEVVTWLRDRAFAADDDTDLSLADPEYEAVRLTTVFKAKGTEARVAVITAAQRDVRAQEPMLLRQVGKFVARAGKQVEPPAWDSYVVGDKKEVEEEFRRFMYVAATRARDQLVVVVPGKANLLAPDLLANLPTGEDGDLIDVGPATVRVRLAAALPVPLEVPREIAQPGKPARTDFGATRSEALRVAVTRCTRRSSVTEAVSDGAVGDGTGIGSIGGTAVHLALEHLDLGTVPKAADVERRVQQAARRTGLGDEDTQAVRTVVNEILIHPVFADARAAPFRWSEVPFAFVERGRIITGTIDLCFPQDTTLKRWTVVEWKSNLPEPGKSLRAAYERQIALYARALLATSGCEHVDPVLVGPHPRLRRVPEESAVDEDRDGEEPASQVVTVPSAEGDPD